MTTCKYKRGTQKTSRLVSSRQQRFETTCAIFLTSYPATVTHFPHLTMSFCIPAAYNSFGWSLNQENFLTNLIIHVKLMSSEMFLQRGECSFCVRHVVTHPWLFGCNFVQKISIFICISRQFFFFLIASSAVFWSISFFFTPTDRRLYDTEVPWW